MYAVFSSSFANYHPWFSQPNNFLNRGSVVAPICTSYKAALIVLHLLIHPALFDGCHTVHRHVTLWDSSWHCHMSGVWLINGQGYAKSYYIVLLFCYIKCRNLPCMMDSSCGNCILLEPLHLHSDTCTVGQLCIALYIVLSCVRVAQILSHADVALTRACAPTRTCARAHTHARARTHAHTRARAHTRTHTHTHIYTHTQRH